MGYRELFKHNDKLYIIKAKAPISSFTDKQGKLHLEFVKGMQNHLGADHTLKTESHFLFVETIEEIEFEELCHE
jgi:hypothetical protein